MRDWLWWLIVAGAFGLAEVMTTTLVFAMLAGGALAAAVTAAVVGGGSAAVVIQLIGFLVVSVALLGLVRPIAKKHLTSGPRIRTGAAALVGRQAVVLVAVDGHDKGRVKLNGEVWSARSYDGQTVHDVGKTVDVVEIDGATALVM
jgi:membrane protein implicated in regulation of membrane protease activity